MNRVEQMNRARQQDFVVDLPEDYRVPSSFAGQMTGVARKLLDDPEVAQHEALAWAGRYYLLKDRTALERQEAADLRAEYEILCQQHSSALQEVRELKRQLRERALAAVPPAIPPEVLELTFENKFRLRVTEDAVKKADRQQLEDLMLQATAGWLVNNQMVQWLIKQLCGGAGNVADQGRDKAEGGRVGERHE